MFSLNRVNDSLWCVCDENQQAVFVGDWRAVEDWLDLQENLARSQSQLPARRAPFSARISPLIQELLAGDRATQN